MKKFTPKAALLSAGALVALSALVATTATIARAGDDDAELTVALPAPTIINAINAAIAAKPGDIKSVETEVENGVNQIEVAMIATNDGKPYEITLDAATAKVLKVEADMSKVPVTEVPPPETPLPDAPVPETPLPDAPLPETPLPQVPVPDFPMPGTMERPSAAK